MLRRVAAAMRERRQAPDARLPDRTKVLYVAGYFRSGSTILDRMLGQVPGFFSVGELRFIWEESFALDQPCGCGAPFSECEFWSGVVGSTFGELDRADLDGIVSLKRRVDRMRHIPRLVSPLKGRGFSRDLADYTRILGRLYGAVREASGARVIVDSSKDASYAYVLNSTPGVDLRVVHLVRDSRAVAHSWSKEKLKHETREKEKVYLPRIGPGLSSARWTLSNLLLEPLRLLGPRHMMVRYEDLMADPRGVLARIAAFAGEDDNGLPFLDGSSVRLGVNHTVAGNPMRFKRGEIEVRADERWKAGMTAADRRTVTALTAPLLLRYGYDLTPGSGG
jgi:hypothetical protein